MRMSVLLETSLGDITIDLYTDERPKCCLNFLKLCKVKYYNFCLFHSVQRNLVAQTGDPLATGRGGESIFSMLYGAQAAFFDAEITPRIKHKKRGTVSMVNNGSNMHGSQFFITLGSDIDYLDAQQHTVFGQVAEGFDVLQKFNEAFVDPDHRPYKDIRIFHTIVLHDPFDDPAGLIEHIPSRSPVSTAHLQTDSIRIGVDEALDDDENLNKDDIEERIKAKEAHANAQILEMIGDLPDVDVRPPDNVLFVCKLNPVTSAEDLEVIFSRFGPIDCCEVIKDDKTKESLQYAFIEFSNAKDCESAYFKMDNVLIDDRRIHVDFSQSVSKVKWKGKGKGVEYKKNVKDDHQQFRIKDPDIRTDNSYDLVFDDVEKETSHHKKTKKTKKQKKKRSRSEDSDNLKSSRSEQSKHKKVENRTKHHEDVKHKHSHKHKEFKHDSKYQANHHTSSGGARARKGEESKSGEKEHRHRKHKLRDDKYERMEDD